jgi:hypothetical protein
MKFRSVIHYRVHTPETALLGCLRDLKSLDLEVTWSTEARAIAFDVPETMLAWLKAGGLRTLLAPYQTHIVCIESFREVDEDGARIASQGLAPEANLAP